MARTTWPACDQWQPPRRCWRADVDGDLREADIARKDAVMQATESATSVEYLINATVRATSGKGKHAELEAVVQTNNGMLYSRVQLPSDGVDGFCADIVKHNARRRRPW